jgi:hypothetical protein
MIKEQIKFKPFVYTFNDYEGKPNRITFTCPECGGHNCEKIEPSDKYCFWSGYYRCTDCGCTHDAEGRNFAYYSDCFKREEIQNPIQLELFT